MIILKIALIVIGLFIGILLLGLVGIVLLPFNRMKKIHMTSRESMIPEDEPKQKQKVRLEIEGDRIDIDLFLPDDRTEPVGCIIMSNGFGGTKGKVLDKYAMRFLEAGFATLLYDFRNFGLSEGEPRQYFSVEKQLDDLKAVIDYARSLDAIDSDKVCLWGTSGSGGYGMIIASEDKRIACTIGQCPALDKDADGKLMYEREGLFFLLRLLVHAIRDKRRAKLGLSPHRIPIVGREGDLAIHRAKGAFEGYEALISPTFKNEICARMMLETKSNNPIDFADRVDCPVLLLRCEKDNLVSEASYNKTAAILGELATVKTYPCDHFQIYQGEYFEMCINDQLMFLEKHL